MNEARSYFLPRSGGAGDEDASVGRCGTFGSHANLFDRRRCTDQLSRLASPQLELGDLALQFGRFKRARDGEQEAIAVQRLLDEFVGALLDGGNGCVDRSVPADHDDRHLGVAMHHRFQDVHAVELAPLKPDVQNDHRRRWPRIDGLDCTGAVRCIAGRIAAVLQNPGDGLADKGFVVDDQYVAGHQFSPFTGVARSVPVTANTSVTLAPPSSPFSTTRRPP